MDKLEVDWMKLSKNVRKRVKKQFKKPTTRKVKRPKKFKSIPLGWSHLTSLNYYWALRDSGVKLKRLLQQQGKIVICPSWAAEMIKHPQCTRQMLARANKDIRFRKVTLMEERLRKRAKGSTTNLLVHQTAVELGESVHRQLQDYRKKNEAVHLRMEEWLKRNS